MAISVKAKRKEIYTAIYEFIIADSNKLTLGGPRDWNLAEFNELKEQLIKATEILQKISFNLGRRHSSSGIENWKKEEKQI